MEKHIPSAAVHVHMHDGLSSAIFFPKPVHKTVYVPSTHVVNVAIRWLKSRTTVGTNWS